MKFRNYLRPVGQVAAMGLAVAMIGAMSPAWAHDVDDDHAKKGDDDKRATRWEVVGDEDSDGDVRVYEWNEKDGEERDGEKKNFRFRFERADSKGGYLGVQVQNVTRALMRARDLPTDKGALVNSVEDEGPAEAAGVERGDVIVELNRKKIERSSELIELLRDQKPGARVDIVVYREGRKKSLRVELGKRPPNAMMFSPREFRGNMHPRMEKMFEGNFEFRSDMDELKQELEALREELRELRRELKDARGSRSGSRSGS
jgi:membrane-associated protease RseP (regulator of RpoE activity)